MIKNGIAASNQYGVGDRTSVFVVRANGQLQVYWVLGGAWNGQMLIGSTGCFPPGAAVAASPHYGVNNQTDVFAVGADGQLRVASVLGGGAWNGPSVIEAPKA